MPGEEHRQQRRVADDGDPAVTLELDRAGHELAGGDADADGHVALTHRGQFLVDRTRRADGVQDAAVASEDADEAVADDLADETVLPRHFRFLKLHGPADGGDHVCGIAAADGGRQLTEIGDEDRSFVELGRLALRRRAGGFPLLGSGRHLLVKLFDLRLVAQSRNHLRERAPEDSDLIFAVDRRVDVVVAARHGLGDARQLLDRTRDALCDQPGEDECQEQSRAAAGQKRILDLLERRQLAVERAEEHRCAHRLVP